MFAGINGAGKSTHYDLQQVKYNADLGVRVCPDDILVEYDGYWENYKDVYASGRIACKKINDCLAEKKSFNWEYTLVSDYVVKIMEKAKAAGYQIRLNFILVDDVQMSLDRVAERVKNGGHGIPEDVIRSRFDRQLINIDKALSLAEMSVFYDNKDYLRVVGFATTDTPLAFFEYDTNIAKQLDKKIKDSIIPDIT